MARELIVVKHDAVAAEPLGRLAHRRFLSFIVEETIGGRGDRIKAYAIATSAFGPDLSTAPDRLGDSAVRAGYAVTRPVPSCAVGLPFRDLAAGSTRDPRRAAGARAFVGAAIPLTGRVS